MHISSNLPYPTLQLFGGPGGLGVRHWPPLQRVMNLIPSRSSEDFFLIPKVCDVRKTKPPLWFRAHVKLGSLCQPSSSVSFCHWE
jgi:hypothetical protein